MDWNAIEGSKIEMADPAREADQQRPAIKSGAVASRFPGSIRKLRRRAPNLVMHCITGPRPPSDLPLAGFQNRTARLHSN
jgi:hypothetical protein